MKAKICSLSDFLNNGVTPYHVIEECKEILNDNGFTNLSESEDWNLSAGKNYYVTRNGSSIIAFRIPKGTPESFMISASHSDSPSFRIKDEPEIKNQHYTKLSVEGYGDMLCSTWLDRPLCIAGRVLVKENNSVTVKNVKLTDTVIIPNVAIHMNRTANTSSSYNNSVDMIPFYKSEKTIKQKVADILCDGNSEAILSTELMLCNAEKPFIWDEFISSPRLDDLQCAYSSLSALINSANTDSTIQVCAVFDNEEVGSGTKQGAASTFLFDTLERVCHSLSLDNTDYRKMISQSFMLSCDNAHAVHPNHPEYADKNHEVYMNEGIVIKYNANQKYTSDAVSTGIFRMICNKAKVPYQCYANRADMPGGSTLGNISASQVSVNTVDIGLAQLAMHSAYETAGMKDTEYMIKAIKEFYKTKIIMSFDGNYKIN